LIAYIIIFHVLAVSIENTLKLYKTTQKMTVSQKMLMLQLSEVSYQIWIN